MIWHATNSPSVELHGRRARDGTRYQGLEMQASRLGSEYALELDINQPGLLAEEAVLPLVLETLAIRVLEINLDSANSFDACSSN